jgi:hypothetical protein
VGIEREVGYASALQRMVLVHIRNSIVCDVPRYVGTKNVAEVALSTHKGHVTASETVRNA